MTERLKRPSLRSLRSRRRRRRFGGANMAIEAGAVVGLLGTVGAGFGMLHNGYHSQVEASHQAFAATRQACKPGDLNGTNMSAAGASFSDNTNQAMSGSMGFIGGIVSMIDKIYSLLGILLRRFSNIWNQLGGKLNISSAMGSVTGNSISNPFSGNQIQTGAQGNASCGDGATGEVFHPNQGLLCTVSNMIRNVGIPLPSLC